MTMKSQKQVQQQQLYILHQGKHVPITIDEAPNLDTPTNLKDKEMSVVNELTFYFKKQNQQKEVPDSKDLIQHYLPVNVKEFSIEDQQISVLKLIAKKTELSLNEGLYTSKITIHGHMLRHGYIQYHFSIPYYRWNVLTDQMKKDVCERGYIIEYENIYKDIYFSFDNKFF